MITGNNKQSGFTLIEIAVVMVIVGVLLGGFIGTFSERIDTTRYIETEEQLEEIKSVLMAYAFTRSPPRLPCPDIDANGFSNIDGSGNCSAAGAVGLLPSQTLGLGGGDSWGNRYSYWVSDNYAGAAGFGLGAIDLGGGNAAIETRVNDLDKNIAINAVAVVFSHGKNGLGAMSVQGVNRSAVPAMGNGHDDENQNIDANFIFMSRVPTAEGGASTGGVFDDILIWINSYEIKAKMVETGVLPL